MSEVSVGIDVGMSYLKVAVFDREGRLVGRGQAAYKTERPGPGSIEQDPEQWIDSAGDVIRKLVAEGAFRPEQVAAIAPSARGSGAVFVDENGEVLAPHWMDGRHGPQARDLVARFGPAATSQEQLVDHLRDVDTRALPSKTLHFKEHHPDLFARMKHPLFVHDFMLYRMSGVVATDPSSGPRTPDYSWPREVWEYIGVPFDRVPQVRQHTEIAGPLLPATAKRLGLPAGIPVAIGGHDGACANAGAGAIAIGQVCMTMGTNVVARSITDVPAPQVPWRGISAYHFIPGRWCCGGDAGFAGHAPTWLANAVGRGHAELEAAAREVPPGSNGVIFLPFLHGQVAPERRPTARAAFIGMSETTGRAELYRATMEGVCYLYRWIAHRLGELNLGHGEWRVSGGGALNRLWMEIMASTLERPLSIGEPEEGPRGAAMFAAVGLGWYPDLDACAADWVRTIRVVEPDPCLTEAYLKPYDRFRRLAEAVHSAETSA